ncbi:MAG: HEPN domain-containing protein [Bryobacteraceae bacterium]
MNRKEFQALAEKRLEDANVLFRNRRFDGAYYLAGYVVECALKACIAKKTKKHEFPPKRDFVSKVYTHSLNSLLEAAALPKLSEELRNNKPLEAKWGVVKDWNEESRYKLYGRKKAKGLLDAVSTPVGVLACLRKYW